MMKTDKNFFNLLFLKSAYTFGVEIRNLSQYLQLRKVMA